MAYTVKKLSEFAGVTVRTLHFYEEIGLLKPSYYGGNGYRYYEEKELLQLQQILFYKELGFSLKQIQKVLGRDDFNQLVALYSHRKSLFHEGEKIKHLLKTIDNTIKHLKGEKKMNNKELFDGFNIDIITKAMPSAPYFSAEEIVLKSVKHPTKTAQDVEKRGVAFYKNINESAHSIYRDLSLSIKKGLDPSSNQVQRMIKKHHILTEEIHDATHEVYMAMAKLYQEHPEFRKQLDSFHPELAVFMAEAMKVFANQKLSLNA
ncbi:MAG: MerR family transcriptional regulator [Simkaniaceae bacterium]|nr:MerR family transcriptional regulator [Simkaniaceae bacterium]